MDISRSVLHLLRSRDRVKVEDLAHAIGTSTRTVRRALTRLEESDAELSRIPDVVSALADCEDNIDPATLLGLWSAVTDGATVRVRYRNRNSAITERAIDPLAVHEVAAHWYLVAWCHRRRAQRVFRLDRVQLLARTGTYFAIPTGIDTLAAAYRAVRSKPAQHQSKVWIGAKAASVREWLPPYRATLDEVSDGVVATLRVEHRWAERIAMDLLAADVAIRVLQGDALRAALNRVAERAAELARAD